MLIDWFTVGAQVLNFGILVLLMRRYLYKPILHAIDAREKRIAAEIADADAKRADAQKEHDEFKRKNEVFDQQRTALLDASAVEAKTERKRIIDAAQQAADALAEKRKDSLRRDADRLNQAVTRRAQQEVFAIARKALVDLAATSLEERLGDVFTRRLRALDGVAKARLCAAREAAKEPAVVRSAFELPPAQRATVQNALNEAFAADVHVRFETAPQLISGIEFAVNGQKVAWTIDEYLTSLERAVDELLDAPAAAAPPQAAVTRPAPAPPATSAVH